MYSVLCTSYGSGELQWNPDPLSDSRSAMPMLCLGFGRDTPCGRERKPLSDLSSFLVKPRRVDQRGALGHCMTVKESRPQKTRGFRSYIVARNSFASVHRTSTYCIARDKEPMCHLSGPRIRRQPSRKENLCLRTQSLGITSRAVPS